MPTLLKRQSEDRDIEALAMANCLMLLSSMKTGTEGEKAFTCKTCDRKFRSFQALGGHRASHKKLRLTTGDLISDVRSPVRKPNRTHACPICEQEFAIGQALGGHMRRHRADVGQVGPKSEEIVAPILLKRSSSGSKRVVCLDLNLTPFENDVKLGIKTTLPSWLIA